MLRRRPPSAFDHRCLDFTSALSLLLPPFAPRVCSPLHSCHARPADFFPISSAGPSASEIHRYAGCASIREQPAWLGRRSPPPSLLRQALFSCAPASRPPCQPRRNTNPPACALRCSSQSLFPGL